MVRLTSLRPLLLATGLTGVLSAPNPSPNPNPAPIPVPVPVPDPVPADFPIAIPNIDLVSWWLNKIFICPLWKGTLPNGFQDLATSICYNSQTKTFTSPNGGTITARLYEIPGAWQKDARYSEITKGIGDAIKKGLSTFSTFIPSPASSLQINVGIAWGGIGERVRIDSDNSGTKSPCYILINYPADWIDIPVLALQKNVIQKMYQCVEQFHKPTVTAFTDANEWWRWGIARYFDGLSYPAIGTKDFLGNGLYPEEYHYGIPLYQNDDAAALFFHFVDMLPSAQGGWSPADVHNWMKGHANRQTYDQERTALVGDTKITSGLWHKFIMASIDGTIKYANGQKIINTVGGVPRREHSSVVETTVGRAWTRRVAADPFKGSVQVFTVKAGQTFKVSVEQFPGLEWSLRKVGTTAWNSGQRARTVTITVPAGANQKYEFAVSYTGPSPAGENPEISFARTA